MEQQQHPPSPMRLLEILKDRFGARSGILLDQARPLRTGERVVDGSARRTVGAGVRQQLARRAGRCRRVGSGARSWIGRVTIARQAGGAYLRLLRCLPSGLTGCLVDGIPANATAVAHGRIRSIPDNARAAERQASVNLTHSTRCVAYCRDVTRICTRGGGIALLFRVLSRNNVRAIHPATPHRLRRCPSRNSWTKSDRLPG